MAFGPRGCVVGQSDDALTPLQSGPIGADPELPPGNICPLAARHALEHPREPREENIGITSAMGFHTEAG